MQNGPYSSLLGTPATTTIAPFRGPATTLDQMEKFALGIHGERSMLVRSFLEWFLRHVQPKDYLGEILAIRNIFVQPSPMLKNGSPLFRYTNDPRHLELVKSPERIIREVMEHGSCLMDCDEASTLAATFCLQCGRKVELVALGFAPNVLSHVGVRAEEPKSNKWIWIDSVAGPREREAAQRAKAMMVRSLD